MKPTFIVIGSMKSGTTSLCHLLGQHKDIFMSNPKEIEFFCKPELYDQGMDWYEAFFDEAKGNKAIGEGSTSYTKAHLFPNVPEKIAQHLPGLKLIYIVRHPLERIESQWMFNARENGVHKSFSRTLRDDSHLINTSKYWWQINKYREHFNDSQIKVLFFEDFKLNPEIVLNECFQFLEVSEDTINVNIKEKRNVTPKFEIDNAPLVIAKQVPGYSTIKNLIPTGLKNKLRHFFNKEVSSHPSWEPKVKKWVIEQLESDTRQFLDFYNKPKNYWKL